MNTRLIDLNKCLFVLIYEDAQFTAKDIIGRELTEEELSNIRKGIEWGLECWPDVMRTAVRNVAGVDNEDNKV